MAPTSTPTATTNPHEDKERDRLRTRATNTLLVPTASAAVTTATITPASAKSTVSTTSPTHKSSIPPSRIPLALRRSDGADILKRNTARRKRYLLLFPGGLRLPPPPATVGSLEGLATRTPTLTIHSPPLGRLILKGFLAFPRNAMHMLRAPAAAGRPVTIVDSFDTVVVFSEWAWVGSPESNPGAVPEPLPEGVVLQEAEAGRLPPVWSSSTAASKARVSSEGNGRSSGWRDNLDGESVNLMADDTFEAEAMQQFADGEQDMVVRRKRKRRVTDVDSDVDSMSSSGDGSDVMAHAVADGVAATVGDGDDDDDWGVASGVKRRMGAMEENGKEVGTARRNQPVRVRRKVVNYSQNSDSDFDDDDGEKGDDQPGEESPGRGAANDHDAIDVDADSDDGKKKSEDDSNEGSVVEL